MATIYKCLACENDFTATIEKSNYIKHLKTHKHLRNQEKLDGDKDKQHTIAINKLMNENQAEITSLLAKNEMIMKKKQMEFDEIISYFKQEIVKKDGNIQTIISNHKQEMGLKNENIKDLAQKFSTMYQLTRKINVENCMNNREIIYNEFGPFERNTIQNIL